MSHNRIRRVLTAAMVLGLAAAISGCASGRQVRSDYDPTVDFGQYRTYNFFSDAGPDDTSYQSFFSTYVTAAVKKEMDARGYVLSENPDLLVNFNAVLQDKTKVTTTPAMGGGMGYYGYRGGFYDPWGGYGYAQETHVSQYTEGTFNIDLVDAKKKKLVWEAIGVGRVNEKLLENLEQRVNEAVPEYFAQFPFTAGSGTPAPTSK